MRLVYIDEAGRSNPTQEPYFVASGVILNGDQDWQPLNTHLKHLVRKHIPEDRRHEHIFHTTEIWSGEKRFSKAIYKGDSRLRMLHDLVAIPKKFHLGICNGFVHRPSTAEEIKARRPGIPQSAIDRLIHSEAYLHLARGIDHWMKDNAPNEVAMLIAEDTDKVKAILKFVHAAFTASEDVDEYWQLTAADLRNAFRTRRIIDTIHFAKKTDSPPLQVADTAAFFVKRQLMRKANSLGFYNKLEPQLYPKPRVANGFSRPLMSAGRETGLLVRIRESEIEVVEDPTAPIPWRRRRSSSRERSS